VGGAYLCCPPLSGAADGEARETQLRSRDPLQGHPQLRVHALGLQVAVQHQQHPGVAACRQRKGCTPVAVS